MCALCGEQPVAGGPDALLGEPLCRGPVCRWCYETRVEPARRHADGGSWAAHGAWALRTPEGRLVIGATADELVMGMMDNGYFGTAPASSDEGAEADIDAVERCIKAAETSPRGRPIEVGAFGRRYVIPWYGPALLSGPRGVVQTVERVMP